MNKIKIQCKTCGHYRTVISRRLTISKHEQNFPRCKNCWKNNCKKTSIQRFWKYVDIKGKNDCWPWIGHKRGPAGYGGFKMYKEKEKYAHRISFEIFTGKKIPEGMCVLHSCDNPLCVNPAHLWIGTQLENIKDRESKGRGGLHKGEANGRSKLTRKDVENIRIMYATGNYTQETLGKLFGVAKVTIGLITRRKIWI